MTEKIEGNLLSLSHGIRFYRMRPLRLCPENAIANPSHLELRQRQRHVVQEAPWCRSDPSDDKQKYVPRQRLDAAFRAIPYDSAAMWKGNI